MEQERNYKVLPVLVIAVSMIFFIFFHEHALADKLMAQPSIEGVPISYSRPPAPQPSGKDQTEEVIDILLSQGVAGVGLIVLGWWIKTSTAQARADRLRIEERVFDLIDKTNSNLTGQRAELENISRELERLRG